MTDVLFIVFFAGLVWHATRPGLAAGFPLAVGLLVFLPGTLCVQLPGALPELTVHRVILALLVSRWWGQRHAAVSPHAIKLGVIFAFFLTSRTLSTMFSITPGPSIKDLLAFSLETVLFYYIACAALAVPGTGRATARAVLVALVAVAGVAFVERYARISLPYELFPHFKHCYNGVQSTYPHRILLGYAMAMGLPLAFWAIDAAQSRRERLGWWAALAAMVTTCFLADTRGGWMGMAIAGGLIFLLGTAATRRRCVMLAFLALAALAVRPGIRATILSRIEDTYAGDSYKATSYQYRWKLWEVAGSEISRAPERLLFGYGGQSTESMDLSRHFRPKEGGMTVKTGFTSWDNHYASDLIEFGAFGLGVEVLGFSALLWQLWQARRRAEAATRPFLDAAIAGAAVFFFARTNVFIFGEQPKFLFWIIVAVAAAAARDTANAPAMINDYTGPLPEPTRA